MFDVQKFLAAWLAPGKERDGGQLQDRQYWKFLCGEDTRSRRSQAKVSAAIDGCPTYLRPERSDIQALGQAGSRSAACLRNYDGDRPSVVRRQLVEMQSSVGAEA